MAARFIFILASSTGAGSPQQRGPVFQALGPYYLSLPVNFPRRRKPEYPEKTHDFRQSVDYTHFTRGLGSSPPYRGSNSEPLMLGTLEGKGELSDHYTTEAPLVNI